MKKDYETKQKQFDKINKLEKTIEERKESKRTIESLYNGVNDKDTKLKNRIEEINQQISQIPDSEITGDIGAGKIVEFFNMNKDKEIHELMELSSNFKYNIDEVLTPKEQELIEEIRKNYDRIKNYYTDPKNQHA